MSRFFRSLFSILYNIRVRAILTRYTKALLLKIDFEYTE